MVIQKYYLGVQKMFTVLVIDDKEVFRRKIIRMNYFEMNKDRFQIKYEASNGLEALEILKTNAVDVVVTDIRMPFIDGIELLRRIYSKRLCCCVILLSEFADFSYAKEGILNGAFDYVLKPIDEEKITETFDRAFNYLETIYENTNLGSVDLRALADFVLAVDRVNALSYANHIAAGLFEGNTFYECVEPINQALLELKKHLLAKCSYLELYVPLDFLCHVETIHCSSNEMVSTFSSRVLAIIDAVAPFIVNSKNSIARRVCLSLLNDVGEAASLNELAKSYFVNPKYLSALLKSETGRGYQSYVNFIKISRAKLLLCHTTKKIHEIALALGYKSVDYFSRIFKRETDLTPSLFRIEFGHE